MKTIIYHNPRCSKCRAATQLLEERGIQPEVIKYLETPPSTEELAEIINKLGITPKELIRFKESRATELGITPADERPDTEWISLMNENPVLIERPIVVTSGKAAIGRPLENILKIISIPSVFAKATPDK